MIFQYFCVCVVVVVVVVVCMAFVCLPLVTVIYARCLLTRDTNMCA